MLANERCHLPDYGKQKRREPRMCRECSTDDSSDARLAELEPCINILSTHCRLSYMVIERRRSMVRLMRDYSYLDMITFSVIRELSTRLVRKIGNLHKIKPNGHDLQLLMNSGLLCSHCVPVSEHAADFAFPSSSMQ